jgi:hypothetical protein
MRKSGLQIAAQTCESKYKGRGWEVVQHGSKSRAGYGVGRALRGLGCGLQIAAQT